MEEFCKDDTEEEDEEDDEDEDSVLAVSSESSASQTDGPLVDLGASSLETGTDCAMGRFPSGGR